LYISYKKNLKKNIYNNYTIKFDFTFV